MPTPFACQKSLFRITIFVSGMVVAGSAWAAPNVRQGASDLFAMFSPSARSHLDIAAFEESLRAPILASSPAVEAVDSASASDEEPHASLIALAMDLRNIRYRRGGRNPDSGFDCSGFVSYVFMHSLGLKLPATSAAQFVSGMKVARNEMRSGDLVFFRTAGKNRISHVGIYLDDGRFIHAPSSGKTVRIDRLDETYWAKRFAGAKRPEGIALG